MFLGLPRYGSRAVPDRRSRSNLASAWAPRIVPPKNYKSRRGERIRSERRRRKSSCENRNRIDFQHKDGPRNRSIAYRKFPRTSMAGSPGKRGSGLGAQSSSTRPLGKPLSRRRSAPKVAWQINAQRKATLQGLRQPGENCYSRGLTMGSRIRAVYGPVQHHFPI